MVKRLNMLKCLRRHACPVTSFARCFECKSRLSGLSEHYPHYQSMIGGLTAMPGPLKTFTDSIQSSGLLIHALAVLNSKFGQKIACPEYFPRRSRQNKNVLEQKITGYFHALFNSSFARYVTVLYHINIAQNWKYRVQIFENK